MKKYYCIKCKVNEIYYKTALYGSKLCGSCSQIERFKDPINCPNYGKRGKEAFGYIDGRSKKKYYCIDCDKEICRQTANYGLGTCNSCSHLNKKLSKKTCDKMSEFQTNRYKNHKEREKTSKAMKGKKKPPFTKEHKQKLSLSHGGTGIPNENKDLALIIRQSFKSENWRTKIFKRDNYTCQSCGIRGCKLEAHHLKQFAVIFKEFLNKHNQYSPIKHKFKLLEFALNYKPFWNINNGQTLCKDCHKLTR